MESKHFKKLLAASALTTFAAGSLFLSNAKVASAQTAEEEPASDVTNQAGGEETLNGDSIVLRALNIVEEKATEAIADLGLSAEAKAGYIERVNAADSIAAVEAILAEAEGEAEEVARVLAEAKEAAKAELREAGLTSDFLINKIDGAQTVEAVNAYKDSLLESHVDSAESRELYEAKQKAYETLKEAGITSDFFLDKVASARTVEGVEAYVNELVESHEDSAESRALYEAKQKAYETLKEAGITSDFFLDKVASARTVEGVEAYVNELVESHEDSAESRALYEAKQKAYETLKEAGITSDFFLDKVASGRTVEGIEAYVDALIQSHEDSKEVEELEDFTLVINIDGEHAQTSEYAQIPYSQFTEILAALTESYLGRGYTYERADFKENNEVVLSFSSPAEDPSYDDLTKPGDDITDVVVEEGPEPGETVPSYDDLTKPGDDITDVVVEEGSEPGETVPGYDDLTKPGDDITDVVVDEGSEPGETTPSYDDLTKPGDDITDVVVDEGPEPGEETPSYDDETKLGDDITDVVVEEGPEPGETVPSYDDLTQPGDDITDVVVEEGPEPGETVPSYDDLTELGDDITDVVVDEGPEPGERTPSYDDLTKPGDDITDVVVDEGPEPGETTPSYDDLTKPGDDITDVVVEEGPEPGETVPSYDDLTELGNDITDVVVEEGPEPGETVPSYDDLTELGGDITDVVVEEGPEPGEKTPSYDDLTELGDDITDVVVEEGPEPGEKTPSYDDLTKLGDDIIDVVVADEDSESTAPTEEDPAVDPSASKDSTDSQSSSDDKEAQDTLPETGSAEFSIFGPAALSILAGLGMIGKKREDDE